MSKILSQLHFTEIQTSRLHSVGSIPLHSMTKHSFAGKSSIFTCLIELLSISNHTWSLIEPELNIPAVAILPQNLHFTTRLADPREFGVSTWSSGSTGIAFGSVSLHFEQTNVSMKGGEKESEEMDCAWQETCSENFWEDDVRRMLESLEANRHRLSKGV